MTFTDKATFIALWQQGPVLELTTTPRRKADMPNLPWDFSFLEKFKYAPLAALCGLLVGIGLGGVGSWTVLSAVHEREADALRRQVSELKESNQTKDAEMVQLREQLSRLSPEQREAEAKGRKDLEGFLQRLDKEIAEWKAMLWRSQGGSIR